jgi:hypothetical protein
MDAVSRKATKAILSRHWVHSHEEDTETQKVYRPSGYHFPPSRGRASFELRGDGTATEFGIGPTDRPQESEGTWEIADGDTLRLFSGPSSTPAKVLHIASADKKRLVIRK